MIHFWFVLVLVQSIALLTTDAFLSNRKTVINHPKRKLASPSFYFDDSRSSRINNVVGHKTILLDSSSRTSSSSISSSSIGYDEPVFRPPAEWRSLILQVTIGCSWNKCTFCEMYQMKDFSIKALQKIEDELQSVVDTGQAMYVRDIFLADGDAMMLPTKHLMDILNLIHTNLPKVRRISSYCLPRNLRNKSVADLTALREAGLSLVYVGCESGNDTVLNKVNKGETYNTSLEALLKLKEAKIKRSIMILLGLGGSSLSQHHARDSAKLCNEAVPEFLSVLTTSFPKGIHRVQAGYGTTEFEFEPLTPRESLKELRCFLAAIEMPNTNKTVFRSDHASNYFVLKGRLGREKERLLAELDAIIEAPEEDDVFNLRPEWARGL